MIQHIDDTAEVIQMGSTAQQKVIKIDLDQMSSGPESSDSDDSSSDSSNGPKEGKEDAESMLFSQHDSEINKIKVNSESTANDDESNMKLKPTL